MTHKFKEHCCYVEHMVVLNGHQLCHYSPFLLETMSCQQSLVSFFFYKSRELAFNSFSFCYKVGERRAQALADCNLYPIQQKHNRSAIFIYNADNNYSVVLIKNSGNNCESLMRRLKIRIRRGNSSH